VVISGDTVYSPSLVRAAERADLLIHDSLSAELLGLVERTAREAGLQLRARMLADVPAYHAGAARAADAARDARVGALALTHVIPPLPLRALEPLFMGDAREHFAGPMWVARDGDLYSLPTGTGARTGGVERARLIGRSAGG
jgi:ribonuclease Z